MHPPELAGAHGVARGHEGRVEATRVADLHRDAGAGEPVAHGDRLVRRARDRLLAERRDAAAGRGEQQLGVRAGRGGDDDAVDTGIQHRLGGGDGGGLADPGGHGVDRGSHGVGDDELVDAGRGPARVSAWKAPIRPRPMSPMRI